MDFIVIFRQGGMIETFETGIYPEWLIITSKALKRTWRFRCHYGEAEGILHIINKPAYEFSFKLDEAAFFITEITDKIPKYSASLPFDYCLCD